MTDYGLTEDGFVAPRGEDQLPALRNAYEAATGLTIDWDRDVFLGNITAILAERLGDLGDLIQAIYDARVPGNAVQALLTHLALIVGVRRRQATHSQASATASGAVGTIIQDDYIVRGGGDDGKALWNVSQVYTIGSGGTVEMVVVAQEDGEIQAGPGDIDEIVTPVSGWDSVTNAASADPGDAREEDSELRRRRQESLQVSGSTNMAAIRANVLEDNTHVQSCMVVDNDTSAIVVKNGITLEPKSVAVIVYPEPAAWTDAQKQAVALTIYQHVAVGIYTNGSAVVATVQGRDLEDKIIRYDGTIDLNVQARTTVVLSLGYELADVSDPVKAVIADFFLALRPGELFYNWPVEVQIGNDVPGLESAVVEFNPGTGWTDNVQPLFTEMPQLTINSVGV